MFTAAIDQCSHILRYQGSSVSSSKKLVTGRLSSHPSCLLILDSIDFTELSTDEIKLHLQTLSSVINVLVCISPHVRILITTRLTDVWDVCLLPLPVVSSSPVDPPAASSSFATKIIEIGQL